MSYDFSNCVHTPNVSDNSFAPYVVICLICSAVGMFIGYSLGKKRSAEEIQKK